MERVRTMVNQEFTVVGVRGPQFTRRVLGHVAEECSTEHAIVKTLCRFTSQYLKLQTRYLCMMNKAKQCSCIHKAC